MSISAVVCTWNAAASIDACLRSLRPQVDELIVVDADSTDGTRTIVKRFADHLFTDPRQGLAMARNIGISQASGEELLNAGADNVFPPGSVRQLVTARHASGWSGVGACTVPLERGRLARHCRWWWQARFFPGERPVIGTPNLFSRQLLQQHPYDPAAGHADDTEICERLASQGHRFGISTVQVYECGMASPTAVRERCRRYGASDAHYWRRHIQSWGFRRRVRSLLHPWRAQLGDVWPRLDLDQRCDALPFLLWITWLRYRGWWRCRGDHG
jgi:glycosyltransferase involved in cell wall biosynthesis